MKIAMSRLVVSILLLLAVGAIAQAKMGAREVPKGTAVTLVFDQALNSKTAKAGQAVKLHVKEALVVGGKVVLKAGTPVKGVIESVKKRKSYGVNASLRIALNPVKSVYGKTITLQPQSKGKIVAGKKSEQAAGATVGGAAVLGPVGLVGGYFIHGKEVKIKKGDQLMTEVANKTWL